MSDESCGSCRFLMKGPNICRRYPPQTHVLSTAEPPKPPATFPEVKHELRAFFPEMDPSAGWCGEFQRLTN